MMKILNTIIICACLLTDATSEKSYYTVEEAAAKAFKEKISLLRTNEGKIYTTYKDAIHPEIMFVSDNKDPTLITELWITSTPSHMSTKALINHFRSLPVKPGLHIGRIATSAFSMMAQHRALMELIENGFNVTSWSELQVLYANNIQNNNNEKTKNREDL
ncbi:PREDICTED: uncharacterized protein LOC100636839 [Amphimedon queenslandica]|uniref:Uncharacterized protein n=1 Tax=Amphimedon queenslandica TaxID=400682 RepID=A0A1X7UF85_AMPQE|nr:PREDICTED: uncharacterized protein LOC100636839 [Amphimedon queenslandica]|eukprot:XP_003388204.1 PREDICTED: uncharacterized protein LOC100636839 [Amphimedon queenslandica]